MSVRIGRRVRVPDLRSTWARETDLSNWLVSDDGLALIAEDIGIEVEDARRESRPGEFPCDIVGHALGDENHAVVVENQFGRTDHDHLGKLLTYASADEATTCIWIAEKVSDDHRRVIDWLNENTPPRLCFYPARLLAYRIGDSPAVPQLDVVSRPNVQTKLQRASDNAELQQRHVRRRECWQEILDHIRARKAGPQLPYPAR